MVGSVSWIEFDGVAQQAHARHQPWRLDRCNPFIHSFIHSCPGEVSHLDHVFLHVVLAPVLDRHVSRTVCMAIDTGITHGHGARYKHAQHMLTAIRTSIAANASFILSQIMSKGSALGTVYKTVQIPCSKPSNAASKHQLHMHACAMHSKAGQHCTTHLQIKGYSKHLS